MIQHSSFLLRGTWTCPGYVLDHTVYHRYLHMCLSPSLNAMGTNVKAYCCILLSLPNVPCVQICFCGEEIALPQRGCLPLLSEGQMEPREA